MRGEGAGGGGAGGGAGVGKERGGTVLEVKTTAHDPTYINLTLFHTQILYVDTQNRMYTRNKMHIQNRMYTQK